MRALVTSALAASLHLCVAGCVLIGLGVSGASAAPSSEAPAALLVFPLISVDSAAGVDTVVQLTNLGDDAQAVRCVYLDASLAPRSTAGFLFTLTPAQPIQWRASRGLVALPIPGSNSGAIPAVPVTPFGGTLRCVAALADGTPTASDALIGVATVERGAPAVDSASYAAIGFAATGTSADTPDVLVLGGPQAEYAACPIENHLPLLLDNALIDLGADGAVQRRTATLVALATCSSTPAGGAQATVELVVTNEFGQQLSFTRGLREVLISDLSRLDTEIPRQSIFNAANAGSPHGIVSFIPNSPGSSVLAVALTAFVDPGDAATSHRAAVPSQANGDRDLPDLVDLALPTPPPPSCAGDCNADGTVTINELILGVNIALDSTPPTTCPAFDSDANDAVAINELIAAVNAALTGC